MTRHAGAKSKMNFEINDLVSTLMDGNEVEGTIVKIMGVNEALMKTQWGQYIIDLDQTKLLKREEMVDFEGIDYGYDQNDY